MDPTPAPIDIDQLDRQLSGVSPQVPVDRDIILETLASGTSEASSGNSLDSARAWSKVQTLIAESSERSAPRISRHPVTPSIRRTWLTASAMVGCLAAVIIGVMTFQNPGSDNESLRVVSTVPGQQTTFKLPDGSTVQLAPDSRVEFAESFGRSTRAVTLFGEAVFTVTHHSGAPFVVRANQTSIRVLGTMFGVRAYATDDSIRVAVAEGKVGVENGPVLTMGELATVAPNGESVVSRGDVVSPLSWTQGRLVYQDAPLSRLREDLSRWYGISLVVDHPDVQSRRVTTEITEQTLDDALRMLARAMGMQYMRTESQIIFSKSSKE